MTTTSEWLLPCPICQGPIYVHAWRTDGWTDCEKQHRLTIDPLTYERARRAARHLPNDLTPSAPARAAS